MCTGEWRTMAVDDLVAFLNARYTEAEAMAAVVHIGSCATMTGAAIVYGVPATCDCGQPELIRADVAAKRRITRLHGDGGESMGYLKEGGYGIHEHACTVCGTRGEFGVLWPCTTLRLLAAPFAGHPDFRMEWSVAIAEHSGPDYREG